MTFTEIDIACKGYEKRTARANEVNRLVATILINVNRKPGSSPVKPEDVFPLYTDKRGAEKLMTKDEFEELKEWRKGIKWQTKS